MKANPLKRVTDKYAFRITDTIASLITGAPETDPIARQYIPQQRELTTTPEENDDPIGDEAHTPVKGIVHRYPDRVLFKPTSVCAVYCRYCFRREMVGPKDGKPAGILNAEQRKAALNYIRDNTEIWEVILTGGDPLILSARHLKEIMDELRAIPHVKVIRIHTRIPIADPDRVTPALINALTKNTDQSVLNENKAIYMALHINHASEINDDIRRVITALHNAGINLLSQSVLLKGVNDNAETLAALYRTLVSLNVKPYYLHHPDFAPGTSHFRLTIAEGQAIIKQLLGSLSGICQPTYMLDIPGGYGKIPLTPCYIEELENNAYTLTSYKGETHAYPPQNPNKEKIK